MTQPSNLKVKRLVELDALPEETTSEAWMYAVQDSKDYKVSVDYVSSVAEEAVLGELSEAGGSDLVGYRLDATDSVVRTVESRLSDTVSVKDFGAVGDGVTDDSMYVIRAIVAAYNLGANLFWPAGTYFIPHTTNIPAFHSVRHTGPGVVKKGSFLFHITQKETQTNTFYVNSSTGSDSNDGLHTNTPFATLAAALNNLSNYGPTLGGPWAVLLAAGTYAGGGLVPRGIATRDYLTIRGPLVGHPNTPTVIVSKAADTSKTFGIMATDGQLIRVSNIKFTGAFSQAEYIGRACVYQRENVHVDGAVTGLQINDRCAYYNQGGIIENCTAHGINELFHITRDFGQNGSNASELILRNNAVGLKAKENCVGHLDYVNFEDNDTGLEFHLYSGANVKLASFKRNDVGILLSNSEIHNETSVQWGTGADANGIRILELGMSATEATMGWNLSNTIRVGHRPLLLRASDYVQKDHTGTVTETNLTSFLSPILPAGLYAAMGKRLKVIVYGRTQSALAGTVRILLRLGGVFATDVTLPSGMATNKAFKAEFEIICTADGSNQLCTSTLQADGMASATTVAARTINLATADAGVIVSSILANSADTLRVHAVELHG